MLRCFALLFLLLCSCAQTPIAPAPKHAGTPNIVFILADDLRFDMLAVSGNTDIHTPNLDRLARRGVFFTQAASLAPQCCAARAVMITGLTPVQSGYTSMELQEPGAGEPGSFERFPTLPSLLSDRGYHTALVGKWHLKTDPWRSGFSETRLWFGGGMCHYDNPALSRGESRESTTIQGNITELFTQDACDFLNSPTAREKPFFLWVAPTAPHEPCGPVPDRISKLYQGKTSKDLVRPGITLGASPRWDEMWVPYFQAVTHLDEQVGRIISAVESAPYADHTVIVFVSDSGIMMGRRGIGSKVVPYEDSIRIPLIISAPWIKPGKVNSPVSDLDLPPTVLAFADALKPPTWLGQSLTFFLHPTDAAAEEPPAPLHKPPVFNSSISMWAENQTREWGEFSNRTIRTPTHKLIVWQDQSKKPPEFYDLARDPHEATNLWPAVNQRSSLMHDLQSWLDRANDPARLWPVFSSVR